MISLRSDITIFLSGTKPGIEIPLNGSIAARLIISSGDTFVFRLNAVEMVLIGTGAIVEILPTAGNGEPRSDIFSFVSLSAGSVQLIRDQINEI